MLIYIITSCHNIICYLYRPRSYCLYEWLMSDEGITTEKGTYFSRIRPVLMTFMFQISRPHRKCHYSIIALLRMRKIISSLVAESLGGWSEEAASTIKAIGRLQGQRSGNPPADAVTHLFQRLSISLWRGNATLVYCRCSRSTVLPWQIVSVHPPSHTYRSFYGCEVKVKCPTDTGEMIAVHVGKAKD